MTDQKEWVLSQQYRDDDANQALDSVDLLQMRKDKAISIGFRSGESVQEGGILHLIS
jgi:hypothetical protein